MPLSSNSIFCEIANIRHNSINKSIVIEEPDNNETSHLKSVEIRGFEDIYFATKLDLSGYQFLGNLVKDGFLKKSCDAIIFAKIKGINYSILVELKSQRRTSIPEKFKNCIAFFEYLKSIYKHYYQNDLNNFKQINLLFDRQTNSRNTSFEGKIEGICIKHRGFGKNKGSIDIRSLID
jgi:hypothetical protein